MPIAEEVTQFLQENNPNLLTTRSVGSKRQRGMTACTDAKVFVGEMVKRGVQQRLVSEPLSTDFKIAPRDLATFIGSYKQLRPIADIVKTRIETENAELITEKRSGPNRVTVCTDKDLFTKYMLEAGARLRDNEV